MRRDTTGLSEFLDSTGIVRSFVLFCSIIGNGRIVDALSIGMVHNRWEQFRENMMWWWFLCALYQFCQQTARGHSVPIYCKQQILEPARAGCSITSKKWQVLQGATLED
jgi:hypothetical protein